MFGHKLLQIMSNFRRLEVVGRGSETQLPVGENLNQKKVFKYICLMIYSEVAH